jgi:hypothetical protein
MILEEVTVEIEGEKPEIDASDEKLDEIKDDIQEAKNEPLEKQIDAVEDIVEKYSLDDIAKAIVSDKDNSPVARLLMQYISDDEPEFYSVSEDDVLNVVEAVEEGDIAKLAECLNMIADMGAGTPAVSIIKGWNDADQNITNKKKLKKYLKGIELDGDIGYKFSDDDDDISDFDSDDYKKSKYASVLSELEGKGIKSLDQLDIVKDKLKSMLNEGLSPEKESIKAASIKISPTAMSGKAPVSLMPDNMSSDEIKEHAKQLLESGNRKGYEDFKKVLLGNK